MMRTLLLLILSATLAGCSHPLLQKPQVDTEVLLRTSSAWEGTAYSHYPTGQPELSLLKIHIPPNTTLDWHSHPAPSLGYLLSGEILVETRDSNKQVLVRAGEALAEVVDGIHRGRTSDQPAELIVFYAGSPGMPHVEQP